MSSRSAAPTALEAHDIQAWLIARLARLLNAEVSDIDPGQPLAELGVGSLEALALSGELEDWLGIQLSATLAWDYPTVELLSAHLAQESSKQSRSLSLAARTSREGAWESNSPSTRHCRDAEGG